MRGLHVCAKRHASREPQRARQLAQSLASPPSRRPLRARNRARSSRHAPERFEDASTAEIRGDHWQRESDNEAVRKKLKPPPVKESPPAIVAWRTGAAVKQAIAEAARCPAEGKSEDVIAQVVSLVEETLGVACTSTIWLQETTQWRS
jgi:hypothetical protein